MFTLKDVQSIIKGLDAVTGLNGAELVFKQTNSKKVLGSFVHAARRQKYLVLLYTQHAESMDKLFNVLH